MLSPEPASTARKPAPYKRPTPNRCTEQDPGLRLLKLMAQGERDISSGDTLPQAEVFATLRQRLQAQRDERDG